MKTWVLAVILGAFAAAARADVEMKWHVAPPPVGADEHDGTAAAPFATLERGRIAAREYLARHELRGDLVIELRGGRYELAQPVRFDAHDSGKNGFVVTYRAAPGETPVLSGGRSITNWTRDSNGRFRASVGRSVDFRQLWIGEHRATRAREPNEGSLLTLTDEKAADGFDLPKDLLANVVLRPDEIELSVLIAWMHKRLRITRLAAGSSPETVRAVIAGPEWDAVTRQPQGDRVYRNRHYWLENAREFLDTPGEFFLDRAEGVLFYQPRRDEDLTTTAVIRPLLENLIVLDGRANALVRDLRFEGLSFAHTGWTRPNEFGFVDVQANSLVPAHPDGAVDLRFRHQQRKDRVPAAFQAAWATRIELRGCRFTQLGGTGVALGAGSHENRIEGNSFFDLAGGGIEIGDDAVRPDDPDWFPRANRIANNFVAHIGADYLGSVGILGYYTDGSVIEHNEIAGLPYTAISQGWGWGQPPAPAESRANRIQQNRLSNFMRRVDDGGGIYTTDAQPGSEISGNFIERMITPDPETKAGGAIYLDQFTSGFHVHHNVVSEAIRWLFIWNPNIRENRVDTHFADTNAQRNDGRDNVVEPVAVYRDRNWPPAAKTIIAGAGLEPAYASARAFSDARECVVENTSVDFQVVAGEWKITAVSGSYAATCQESTSPDARARWLPVLARSGSYEVKVWRTPSAGPARYQVHHARGESGVDVPAGETAEGWHSLGRYSFLAGPGAEIHIRPAASTGGTPVCADTIRLEAVDGIGE